MTRLYSCQFVVNSKKFEYHPHQNAAVIFPEFLSSRPVADSSRSTLRTTEEAPTPIRSTCARTYFPHRHLCNEDSPGPPENLQNSSSSKLRDTHPPPQTKPRG